ncbi:MAG: tripartite tricarboxylate transporter substrate binding protein [Betaproteobacteria bacterium]
MALSETPFNAPIRIIVPVGAGSISDVSARWIAEALTGIFSEAVIIENKPGAGGTIAAETLKRARPDGKTLLLAPIALPVITPLVYKYVGFDPAKDLEPIAQVSSFTYGLAVRADHPAHSVAEFVAWAKSHPAAASFATGGTGSAPHLLGMLLNRAAGIEMVHVSFKNPTHQQMDLLGGHVAASVDALPNLIPLQQAGKIRVLATSGAERSPLLPAVATFKEQRYPMIEAVGWTALYAPAKTPARLIDHLSAAIVDVLRSRDFRQKFTEAGLEATGTTPQALTAIMAADTVRWSAIIKDVGYVAE